MSLNHLIKLTLKNATTKSLLISRPSTQAVSRQFTSDSTDNKSGKVYELRKYVFKPDSVAEFNKLNEMFYLRTNFSKLIGYWSCEMGSQLNSYVHIWEYDNLQHRASVRKELSQNEEWIGKYFTNLCTMMISQENSTMYMPFWCDTVNSSPKQNGIYELMTYTMVMGGPVIWGKQLRATVESHKRLGYSDLVGVWYTDIGDHNTVHVLWRHDSYDSRRIGREKAHSDAVVINKVRDNFRNVTKHSSVIMLPTPWSTIQ